MDRITRHTQNRALGEKTTVHCHPALGHDPWKAQSRRRVQSQTFVDARIEVGEVLHLVGCRNRVIELLVKFFMQFVLDVGVSGEVVDYGASGASKNSDPHEKKRKARFLLGRSIRTCYEKCESLGSKFFSAHGFAL